MKYDMKNSDNLHNKRAFTITEAAEYMCVGRSTIENWLAKGLLPYVKLPSSGSGLRRFVRIRKTDLDEFIEKYYKRNIEVSDTNQTVPNKLVLLPRNT